MIKQLAALALTGSVILGSASSAVAAPIHQPWNTARVDHLLETVQKAGYTVYRGGGPCDTAPAYGFVARDEKVFLICVDNHRGNLPLAADTVRHEAVHVAQFCKADRGGATHALLMPDHNRVFIKISKERLNVPFHMYPARDVPYEAEANVMANILDELQVAKIVKKECGL